jgi:hypothetical protein
MNRSVGRAAAPTGVAAACALVFLVPAGCLTRPAVKLNPSTETVVDLVVPNQAVDKIDLLFDIDNSASMGDKQAFLQSEIGDLVDRLVNPNCVDDTGKPATPPVQSNGGCPAGYRAEFPAVHDMHVGVVTSSLGPRLSGTPAPMGNFSTLCTDPDPLTGPPDYTGLPTHNDDQGHLIARYLDAGAIPVTEGPLPDAAQANYLYWYPPGAGDDAAPSITSSSQLESDLSQLVGGAGIFGCGIESQLESWYRFLVQPDPYSSLQLVNGKAQWQGVDATILKQRHEFLRPDSLVVVVVLSDENDSEIDVRAAGGLAYNFMHEDWTPPRGTSKCASNPADPACQPCATSGTPTNDPACQPNPAYPTADSNDWGYDPNLRHVHMKAKYGIDPQYPIGRYYLGLSSLAVPDRSGEYPTDSVHPNGADNYVGCITDASGYCVPNCVNPLFAASLPDGSATDPATLCNLELGPRATQKSNVFFAHIGGVPNQLLHFDPNDLKASLLTQADWERILGQGAANYTIDQPYSYDYSGIDPHMIESSTPRTTTTVDVDAGGTHPLAPANGPNNDPVNGREWTTNVPFKGGVFAPHVAPVDLEYACTFPLEAPRDCTDPNIAPLCDCPSENGSADGGVAPLSPDEVPPVCDPQTPTRQLYAKAYPTIRELLLAKLMGPAQGIVASICPQETQDTSSPVYGYRPAVALLIDRLKTALNNQCLPQKVGPTDADAGTGAVPCLVLVAMPPANDGATCKHPNCPSGMGLFGPGAQTNSADNAPLDQTVLDDFCDRQENAYVEDGGVPGAIGDPAKQSVCMLVQLTPGDPNAATEFAAGSCLSSSVPGWCYATGTAASGCSQAVQIAPKVLPSGATAYLQCIEETINVVDETAP